MSQEDVQLVVAFYVPALGGGEIEMTRLLDDPGGQQRLNRLLSADAKIRFVTPEAGGVRVMQQSEFEGLEGLREGWQVWMQPWDQFRIEPGEMIDAGSGQVLLLARATARMRDSGVEIPQETAALHRVEGGEIVSIAFYLDQAQARRDAGLETNF